MSCGGFVRLQQNQRGDVRFVPKADIGADEKKTVLKTAFRIPIIQS
jgi:hypothetical protein